MAIERIQTRRGTTAEWAAADPTLASGEFGYDTTIKGIKMGDGATPWATLPWVTKASDFKFFRPENYGAAANGTTDDRAAIQAAMDAAYDVGGGIVLLSGRYGWTGDLKHRGAITVMGVSKAKVLAVDDNMDRGLVALDGTSRYRYGQWAGVGSSTDDNPGTLSNLVINGKNVGGASELLLMECVDGYLSNVIVTYSAGDCVQVGGSQNTTIEACLFGHAPNGSAIDFTHLGGQGAGNIKVNNTYLATSRYLITSDSDPANFWPHDVFFNQCLGENYTAGNDLIHLKAGDFQFTRCVFTNSNSGTPAPPNGCLALIQQTAWPTVSTTVVFDSCYFNGGATDLAYLFKIDSTSGVGNNVRFVGRNQFNKADVVLGIIGAIPSLVSIEGTPLRIQGTATDWYAGISGALLWNVYSDSPNPSRWTMPDDASLSDPIAIRREGDVNADRFRISRDGVQRWMDGANAATVLGSISYNSTFATMDLGSVWRVFNGIARRGLIGNVAAPGTAFPVSAAATGFPSYVMNFTTDGASANVTVTGGVAGQELDLGFIAPATGTYAINWPSNVVFAPGAPQPQPQNGAFHYVTVVLNLDGNWYEKSRSLNPNDHVDQIDRNRVTVGQEALPRETAINAATSPSGALTITHFTAYKTETVSQVATYAHTAASGATLCRIGLYVVNADDSLTLVASTASDTTLWNAGSTRFVRSLTASYKVVAGRRYAWAYLFTGTTAPALLGQLFTNVVALSVAPRLLARVSGQTDLPASVAVASMTNAGTRFYAELLP